MLKQIITIASLFVVLTAGQAQAQTKVSKDAHGNYVVAKRDSLGGSKPTGHTITDRKGIVYPVYQSVNGKLFYLRTSRNGNVYKVYIKED